MKKLFLSLVALMVAAVSYAQNTLVATLSHGDEITMYYGTKALAQAHANAVDGDVINLSGGTFDCYGTEITKAIAIRGTGIDSANPTDIRNLTINGPASDTYRFSMEGIKVSDQNKVTLKGTFENAIFIKCQFYGLYCRDNSVNAKNVLFVNCKITNNQAFILRGSSSVQFINSYVSGFNNESPTTASASFVNCVILPYFAGYYRPAQIASSILQNCIVYLPSNAGGALASTTIATNCISINNDGLFNNDQQNLGCSYATFQDVFMNFTGTYSDSETFELSDEAKTTLLGTDGTEIGLYGGPMPYTSIPSYPQVTKMNVANKTTADGKLSVEIEVNSAE